MRGLVLLVLAVAFGGLLGARAEDPPRGTNLTPEERKELEQKWAQSKRAADRAYPLKLDEMEKALRECLALARQLHPDQDAPLVAQSLGNLGVVLHARGKSADAEPLFRDALDMDKRLYKGDHPHVASGLTNLATVLRDRGKYADAEPLFKDALELFKRLHKGDHLSVAISMANFASILKARSKYADAEALFREALEMNKRLFTGDHPHVATSLNNLASVLQDRGQYADAEPPYREALEMRKRLFKGDHPEVALGLNNLADILRERGQYADAEALFREALEMNKRLYKGDDPHVVSSLTHLATVLRERGKYADAEALFKEALEMCKRLFKGDHLSVVASLNNLASVLHSRGKDADAEALLKDALEMRKRLFTGDHPTVATSLNNLASVLHSRGKDADAEALLRDALAMRKRLFTGDHPVVGASLDNLAVVLQSRGKYADAEPLFREALEMFKRLFTGDHPAVARSMSNLASVLSNRGRYTDAEAPFRDAVRMYDRLAAAHARDGAEGDALTLAASQPRVRDGFLSNARANRSEAETVYAAVWASKAVVSRVAEHRALAARAATDPRAAGLQAALRAARRQRAELLLAPAPSDPKTRAARDDELGALQRTIRDLDKDLRSLLPVLERFEALTGATPRELGKVLPPDAAFIDLLAYTHLEQDPKVPGRDGWKRIPSYAAFVVTRDGIHWIELGPADPITGAVRRWRAAITTVPYREPPTDLARDVRARVWAPLRKVLPAQVKVVYLSPDAALSGVPWSALPGDKPGTVVLEELAVAVVPHGPALLEALKPLDTSRRRTAGLLAVGGVSYGAEPEPSGGGWGAAAVALARFRTRGDLPTDPKRELAWTDLAGAKDEADQVRKRAAERGLEVRLVSGRAASAERVLGELGRVKYAHLATHGFFADGPFQSTFRLDRALFAFERGGRERVGVGASNPMVMSGLVFAGANLRNTPGRGVLTGEGLLDRDLSGLELAVLSACETGLGNVADGQGVFGLQRAFHLAGCRNVVASLWTVDDRATAVLMGEFYRRLWDEKDPVPPVEALRQAQLAVMRADPKQFGAMAVRGIGKGEVKPDLLPEDGPRATGGKVNAPAYWAAFTLSGPGR
jgi:CHAT domain-containing protein/tetratricopeptide (TPR) repeat protein